VFPHLCTPNSEEDMQKVLILLISLVATPILAMEKCGSGKRISCIVDGDTFWLNGTKYRMQGYDTPEPTTNICGGIQERELANRATNRLIQLWNSTEITISITGERGDFGRGLVDVFSDGRNVGDILISEGLARSWPDGCEFWCGSCSN